MHVPTGQSLIQGVMFAELMSEANACGFESLIYRCFGTWHYIQDLRHNHDFVF